MQAVHRTEPGAHHSQRAERRMVLELLEDPEDLVVLVVLDRTAVVRRDRLDRLADAVCGSIPPRRRLRYQRERLRLRWCRRSRALVGRRERLGVVWHRVDLEDLEDSENREHRGDRWALLGLVGQAGCLVDADRRVRRLEDWLRPEP